MAAAVGSLMTRSMVRPAILPASLVACGKCKNGADESNVYSLEHSTNDYT